MILIFDLDKTLYSPENGLFAEVDRRINQYLIKNVGIKKDNVNELRRYYWLKFGTTLNGLMKFHNVDPIHYLEYVHDVDVKEFISFDKELKKILQHIPYKKFIFTNGYLPFAKRVIDALGVENIFEDIFDIVWANFIPKPYLLPYRKILKDIKSIPEKIVYFDDFYLNLYPAKFLNMTTILVKNKNEEVEFIDYKIPDIKSIKKLKFIIDF